MANYPCFQLRDGLENCRARFIADRGGGVAFLGQCAGEIDGWASTVERLLANRFPQAALRYAHHFGDRCGMLVAAAGIDAVLSSTPPPALAFLDFTVEDRPGQAVAHCMESVVRRMREADALVDIVMVHRGDQSILRALLHGKPSPHIDLFEHIAERYGLPSVNLARYAIERRSIDLFDWLAYCPDGEANTPLAHTLHARAFDAFLALAWADPAYPDGQPRRHTMPPATQAPRT